MTILYNCYQSNNFLSSNNAEKLHGKVENGKLLFFLKETLDPTLKKGQTCMEKHREEREGTMRKPDHCGRIGAFESDRNQTGNF